MYNKNNIFINTKFLAIFITVTILIVLGLVKVSNKEQPSTPTFGDGEVVVTENEEIPTPTPPAEESKDVEPIETETKYVVSKNIEYLEESSQAKLLEHENKKEQYVSILNSTIANVENLDEETKAQRIKKITGIIEGIDSTIALYKNDIDSKTVQENKLYEKVEEPVKQREIICTTE